MVYAIGLFVVFALGIGLGWWSRGDGAKAVEAEVELQFHDMQSDIIEELRAAESRGMVAVGTLARYVEAHFGRAPAAAAVQVDAPQISVGGVGARFNAAALGQQLGSLGPTFVEKDVALARSSTGS